MPKLYDIANEYAQLLNEELPADMIADTVEAFEGEFTDKVENILGLIKNEQYTCDALKAEAKKLNERAKATQNRIDNLKSYIIESMNTLDKKSMNAGVHSLTVRAPSKSVNIIDAHKLPAEFVEYVTEVKPDKNLIKEKLKLGEQIEGAEMQVGKPSLIVK